MVYASAATTSPRIQLLGFCSFRKLYTFYICPQPLKHLAAGPDGLGYLRIDLIPEDSFGKGKMEAAHAVFEMGQDVLRWDALGGGILRVATP
jgi:hypothetical protein